MVPAGILCARVPGPTPRRLMSLRGSLLLTVALLASGASVCRASTDLPSEIPGLVAGGRWSVPFRANDHGTLRALHAVYASRNTPLWVVDSQPTPAALALLRTLQQVDAYGLEPQDYDADGLVALAAGASGTQRAVATGAHIQAGVPTHSEAMDERRWANFDVNLSAAALKLVCDLHYGRIDPRAAGFDQIGRAHV